MIFNSPHSQVDIPEIALTPFVLRQAQALVAKPALIDGPTGRTLTYGQLAGNIRRAAAGLARCGLRKGDVLAICSPNLPEYAVAFHAVATLGGINTSINPLYTAAEMAYQLKDAGAQYLLTIPPFLDKALEAAGQAGISEVVVFGQAEDTISFDSLLRNNGQPPQVDISPREDLVALPYSSGTTGMSKGVMLTHYNLVANVSQFDVLEHFAAADTLLAVLPFFHIYGLQVTLNYALYKGATIVTMPRFDLEQCLHLMQAYGVTMTYLVPPIILALAQHPLVDNYDLSRLRLITSGAAPLSEAAARACAERLGCTVIQGYGLTETSPVTHCNPVGRQAKIKPASIGPCLPNTQAKVVDYGSGTELGLNQPGEIWVRGPQVMKGYLNNPQATEAAIDGQGWFRTGDVGYADEDGYFYIVDRVKELIKYKAFHVAPAEVEAVLLTHPAVADAAVIPSPDREAGEVPKAFVVLREAATAEEIMAFVAERVAPHKKVRRIEFLDRIPKAASGKILRRLLIERERQ